MNFEIRSPLYDQEAILIPAEAASLSTSFNGTICSKRGDEYQIQNNIVNLMSAQKDYSFAQSTSQWKITASLYEDLWRNRSLSLLTGEEFPIGKEKELLIEWVQPKAGGKYLDVGCSTALYARALKKAEPESIQTGLDFSMPMLEEARLKAEADQTDLFLLYSDARDMPFFGKTFDGIAMGGTLNELSSELKVLFECRRVLKDDGTMFMMHLIQSDTWYGRLLQDSAEWGGIRFWSVKESNNLFKRAGFEVQEQLVKGIVCFTKLQPV